ncbi:hypothetical protein [uncultured Methylobacterium sp.]|uniref:hypothetical protein n=1 Tax=uncultured Methylobacterium sp. TaxID=157278 RepID=UPI0035C9BC9E
MNSDEVAKLAATIEVLSGAVQFLLAERVSRQPGPVQGDLLHVLQRSLSMPTRREEVLLGKAAIVQADLALWMPIVATDLIDDVRRQLGRPPEGVTHIAPTPARALPAASKMAERGRGEALVGAGIRPEDGRSVA